MTCLIISKSRNVWILRNSALYRDAERNIAWLSFLPPDIGTKHQREYLLGGSKELFELMFDEELAPNKQEYSAGTAVLRFNRLQALVRWMAKKDIWRFSQLTADDVISFLRERRGRGGGSLTEQTMNSWIDVFQRMWDLRTLHRGSIRVDIRSLQDEIKSSIVQRRYKAWKAFDEGVAISIISDALHWIEVHGPFLTDATRRSWMNFDRHIALTKRRRSVWRVAFYAELELEPAMANLRVALNEPDLKTHKVLSKAVSALEGACVALLLLLVGLRVSELASLNADCVENKLVQGKELPFINGIAAKKNGRPRHWVAADPLPSIVKFLVDFNAQARSMTSTNALLLNRPAGSPVSLPGRRMSRCTPDRLAKRMKAFVTAPFRDIHPKTCHPHMARKTFAKMAVRRDKQALEPVAHHLGHVFKEFTDGAYVGSDHELAELLAIEDRKELAVALSDLLSGAVAGKGGTALKQLKFRGKKGLSRLVSSLIDKGVQLAPCNWGYCVYSAAFSACRGNDSGPNEVNRTPEICASCSNFSVTEKHRGWWNERATRESEFLNIPDLPEQTRKVVQLRVITSDRILREIADAQRTTRSHVDSTDTPTS